MAKTTPEKHVKNGHKNAQKTTQKRRKFLRLKFVSVDKHGL
jgi:hypothetical protein